MLNASDFLLVGDYGSCIAVTIACNKNSKRKGVDKKRRSLKVRKGSIYAAQDCFKLRPIASTSPATLKEALEISVDDADANQYKSWISAAIKQCWKDVS